MNLLIRFSIVMMAYVASVHAAARQLDPEIDFPPHVQMILRTFQAIHAKNAEIITPEAYD